MAETGGFSLIMGARWSRISWRPAHPPRAQEQANTATPDLLPQKSTIVGAAVIPAAGLPACGLTLAAIGHASSEPYLVGQFRAAGDAGLVFAAAFHRLGGSCPAPEQKCCGRCDDGADD